FSMALRTDAGKTCFDRARELAAKIVRDSQRGDGFSVLLMKDSPLWVIADPSQDAGRVAKEIDNLRQPHGNGSVAATLNSVAALLAEPPGRSESREVYFLTDLQRATWVSGVSFDPKKDRDKNPLQEIQKRARSIFLDVGRDGVGNLAVTDVTLDAPFAVTGQP